MSDFWFFIDGLNPEPWTAPQTSTGRKNGKVFSSVYKNAGLAAYQEAIREDLETNYPDFEMLTCPVRVEFFLWRQLFAYESNDRSVNKHAADATNMQKALEDAIQGIIIDNDRNVVDISTVVVAQAPEIEPHILIKVSTVLPSRPWLARMVSDLRKFRRELGLAARLRDEVKRAGVEDVF